MSQFSLFEYSHRPSNLAFHDLTTTLNPPMNVRSLLGMGLKFIPTPRQRTSIADLLSEKTGTFARLDRSIRLKCFFIAQDPLNPNNRDDDYNPRMYLRSKWEPPDWAVPRALQQRLSSFQDAIVDSVRKKVPIPSNLMRHQRHALDQLRSQSQLLVVNCNKNLGPAVIEREEYIRMAFRDHFSDRRTYEFIPPDQVDVEKRRLLGLLENWMHEYKKHIKRSEMQYIRRAKDECTDYFPYFYLLMKVHKTPLKSRPIVSCSGSLFYAIGVWIDDKLQSVAKRQKSYLKSSFDLKQEITSLELPPGSTLFTSDAVGMYTNIDTAAALMEIGRYLRRNAEQFSDVPINALVAALRIVMTNNIVQFGDTVWRQRTGAAMGTPPAPPYATVFFAIHEDLLLSEFPELFYYRRYIDDVGAIWSPLLPPDLDHRRFLQFQRRLNDYHDLEWETSARTNSVVFLDLTLSIVGNRVTTKLFSKPMNLYLYIPPQSAHPPGVLNGLISGIIFRTYTLCSEAEDVRENLQHFWNRLLACGYNRDKIEMAFRKGIENAKRYLTFNAERASDQETLFFHLRYHPKDPPSQAIQQLWRQHVALPPYKQPLVCLPVYDRKSKQRIPFGSDRLTVCYSRPFNLGNLLSYRKLNPNVGPPVSSYSPITGG